MAWVAGAAYAIPAAGDQVLVVTGIGCKSGCPIRWTQRACLLHWSGKLFAALHARVAYWESRLGKKSSFFKCIISEKMRVRVWTYASGPGNGTAFDALVVVVLAAL